MTKTSFKMKWAFFAKTLPALFLAFSFSACNKQNEINQSNHASSFSAEVVDKWMTMQIRLMKNATGIPNQAFSRPYAYAGIAALESIAPSMPANPQYLKKWNGLSGLPVADMQKDYYWPANVNAALAAINRALFTGASVADKAAIDSLENALTESFLAKESQTKIEASVAFGKAVAAAVYNWSETDGYRDANNPYTPPIGDGMWEPTSPNTKASTPYWGNNRPVIHGSTENTQPSSPTPYSAQPGSEFFEMVKKVYDASQNLTDDQKAMAIYWRDVPGVTSPGHWLSILQQTIKQTNSGLDKAAIAYALTGAAINDGLISCWQTKYHFNLVRPITYIRNVMGHSTWNTLLGTPPHPEYSSAHAVLSAAAAEVFEKIFGSVGSFTDHTYDYLGYAPRTYISFRAIGEEAAQSRLYAGIHYQPSIEKGIMQGRKVAANIFSQQIVE